MVQPVWRHAAAQGQRSWRSVPRWVCHPHNEWPQWVSQSMVKLKSPEEKHGLLASVFDVSRFYKSRFSWELSWYGMIWLVLSVIPFTADKWSSSCGLTNRHSIHRAAGSHSAKLRQLRFSESEIRSQVGLPWQTMVRRCTRTPWISWWTFSYIFPYPNDPWPFQEPKLELLVPIIWPKIYMVLTYLHFRILEFRYPNELKSIPNALRTAAVARRLPKSIAEAKRNDAAQRGLAGALGTGEPVVEHRTSHQNH